MNIWDEIKSGLSSIAPVLANAIIPGSGGIAAGLVSSVLGCDNKPTAIAKSISNATPEQKQALVDLQNKHQEKLIALALENDKLYLQDTQNARSREIEIVKATGHKDTNLYILAWSVVLGFFLLVGIMMFITIPDKNIGPVNQLFGALAAGFGVVLAYFFGSSKSSAVKTKMLGKQSA